MTTTRHPEPGAADVSDAELAAEAIAADPEPCLDGALPFARVVGTETEGDLPAWYMPAPMVGARLVGWRRSVVLTFVASLLVIEAAGLCTTFGPRF
jgi:hypothetical protein